MEADQKEETDLGFHEVKHDRREEISGLLDESEELKSNEVNDSHKWQGIEQSAASPKTAKPENATSVKHNDEMQEDTQTEQEIIGSKHKRRKKKSINEGKSISRKKERKPNTCDICGKRFQFQYQVSRHMRSHTGEKPFQCDVCGKGFPYHSGWYAHMEFHKRQEMVQELALDPSQSLESEVNMIPKEYQCDLCVKGYRNKRDLMEHKRTHTGERPFKCSYCDHAFNKQFTLNRHILTHTEEKAYQCDVCEQRFAAAGGLISHKRSHTGEKPFSCDFCQKDFATSSQVNRHMRIHADDDLCCSVCDESFTNILLLERHNIKTHVTIQSYKCEFCTREFREESTLVSHQKSHFQKKSHKCDICDKCFPSPSHVKMHRRTHTGERPFQCLICQKTFTLKGGLQSHYRRHVGEKNHLCHACDKTFVSSAELKQHLLTHTKDRRHHCSVCNKGFRSNFEVKQHMRTHTGERPYQCEICGKAFSKKSHVDSHKKTHTGEKPYQCNICDRRFGDRKVLKEHQRIHTGEKPYHCHICNKDFRHALYKHMKVHEREGVFQKAPKPVLNPVNLLSQNANLGTEPQYVEEFAVKNTQTIKSQMGNKTLAQNALENFQVNHIQSDPPIPTNYPGETWFSGQVQNEMDSHRPLGIYVDTNTNLNIGNTDIPEMQQNHQEWKQIHPIVENFQEFAEIQHIPLNHQEFTEINHFKKNGQGYPETTKIQENNHQATLIPQKAREEFTLLNYKYDSFQSSKTFYQPRNNLRDGKTSSEALNPSDASNISQALITYKQAEDKSHSFTSQINQENLSDHLQVSDASVGEVSNLNNADSVGDRSVFDGKSNGEKLINFQELDINDEREISDDGDGEIEYNEANNNYNLRELDEMKTEDKEEREAKDNLVKQRNSNRKRKKRKERSKGKQCCEHCGKQFSFPHLLARHMRSHTKEKPYLCHVCDKGFGYQGGLATHLEMHKRQDMVKEMNSENKLSPVRDRELAIDGRDFQCDLCVKAYKNKRDLLDHKRTHTGERPFKCGHCNQGFNKQSILNRHILTHTDERPYKCDFCDQKFAAPSGLISHRRSHTGAKPFHCDLCEKDFTTSSDVKRHIRIHTGKNLTCKMCDETFSNIMIFEKHNISNHITKQTFKCDLCTREFREEDTLLSHKKSHFQKKIHQCDLCGRIFPSPSHVAMHRRIHTGEKPFQCDVCQKSFTLKGALQSHYKRHTGDKKHLCHVCNKRFVTSPELRQHLLTHSGDRQHQCTVCHKKFRSNYEVTQHMRTHTGEKPYKCDLCGRAFAKKSHVDSHKKTHTGEKPYQCDVCGRNFGDKKVLKEHQRIHTGEKPYHCHICNKDFRHALYKHVKTHERDGSYKKIKNPAINLLPQKAPINNASNPDHLTNNLYSNSSFFSPINIVPPPENLSNTWGT